MTTPTPPPAHSLQVFEGVFGTPALPVERWTFTLKTAPTLGDIQANMDAEAAALRDAWVTSLRPLFAGDVVLTRVKTVNVAATGKVDLRTDGSYEQAILETNNPGAQDPATSTRYPLQTALVVSLGSVRAGATGKGRFFLPWPAAARLEPDWRVTTAFADSLMTNVLAFLRGVRAACSDRPLVIPSSKGYLSNVTTVRIGVVPDTMRSRRNQLLEGYRNGVL